MARRVQVDARPERVEQIPAAATGTLDRHLGPRRIPKHDCDPERPQLFGRDAIKSGDNRNIDGIEHDHGRVVIAAGGQRLLGGVHRALLDEIAAGLARQRRLAREDGIAGVPVFRVADRRLHVVGLVHRHHDGAAHLRLVERRHQVIEPRHADEGGRTRLSDDDVPAPFQAFHEARIDLFQVIDLVGEQRIHRGCLVGDLGPLDTVEFGQLAAGRP